MSAGKVEERCCYNFLEFIPYSGVCRGMCGYCWFNEPVLIPKVNVKFFDRLPLFLDNLSKSTSSPVVFTFTHHRTDCFAIEHLTDFVHTAAKFFENREQFFIQYLTKSDNVECLLEDSPSRGSIVCFSVNSPIVSDKVELCTSSVNQRLIAAQKLANSGIPVLLRIDPMLAVDNWRDSYRELVELIYGKIRPKQITLGTPRFQSMDELTSVVKSNKNNNVRLIMEEQAAQMTMSKPGIPVPDGDIRLNYYFSNMPVSYPQDLRIDLYKNVVDACRKYDTELSIGLCEEPLEIWEACDLKWTGKKNRDCTCNFVPKVLT
jgi:spore photoproduct lyase